MRKSLFALGALIGAGAAYLYLNREATPATEEKDTWEPQQHKHDIQCRREREAVASLIDEVVHEPDAPETPIKQAFEHALEER